MPSHARLTALRELWWAEAGRNQVLPLWEGPKSRAGLHPARVSARRPWRAMCRAAAASARRSCRRCWAGSPRRPRLRSLRTLPGSRPRVLCALGDLNGGWAFYLLDGRPVSCLVSFGESTRMAPGRPSAARRPRRDRPVLALVQRARRVPDCWSTGTGGAGRSSWRTGHVPALATAGARMLVGRDGGLPFNDDYEPPFPFTGVLRRVVLQQRGWRGSADRCRAG